MDWEKRGTHYGSRETQIYQVEDPELMSQPAYQPPGRSSFGMGSG